MTFPPGPSGTDDTASLAASVAGSVTGSNTPDNVKVTRPTHTSMAALFFALFMVAAFAILIAGLFTWWFSWPAGTELARIKYLGWSLLISVGCIPIIVFAIASPWVGQIKAEAGNNKIELNARPGQ